MVNDAFSPLTYAKNIVAAIASIGELASSRLLLQDCLLCGQSNEHGLLCDACENALPYLKTAYCPRCAGFSANSEVCGRCLKRKSIYFDSAKAVYHYEFPVDRLIHAFKYGHRLALGNYFGKALADHVGPTDADLIVPMPLHPLRLKERGFNQALELAKQFEDAGVAAIIYTDIARDGVLGGPNVEATAALARAISIPVIASGGVSSLDDLRALKAVESSGIAGVISGRALYDGRINLSEALEVLAC